MRTTHRIAAATLVLSLFLVGCGSSGGSDSSSKKTDDKTDDTSAPASSGPVSDKVEISGFKFKPADFTAKVGDTITITNSDSSTHTFTSTDGPAKFDTGDIAKGKSKTVKLTTKGTYSYECSIHSSMTGTIMVE